MTGIRPDRAGPGSSPCRAEVGRKMMVVVPALSPMARIPTIRIVFTFVPACSGRAGRPQTWADGIYAPRNMVIEENRPYHSHPYKRASSQNRGAGLGRQSARKFAVLCTNKGKRGRVSGNFRALFALDFYGLITEHPAHVGSLPSVAMRPGACPQSGAGV